MVYKRSTSDKRCDEVFAFITEYMVKNGYSPTFREVGEAVGDLKGKVSKLVIVGQPTK